VSVRITRPQEQHVLDIHAPGAELHQVRRLPLPLLRLALRLLARQRAVKERHDVFRELANDQSVCSSCDDVTGS
jgi:hypothetical protein